LAKRLSCRLRRQRFAIPGEKFGQPTDRVALSHAVDHIGEIGLGIELVELCALQHGVKNGGAFAAGLGAEEQEVPPGYSYTAQAAFGRIISMARPPSPA
jgi:hypothetical protein